MLTDLSEDEWKSPVRLEWFEGEDSARRGTSVTGVLGHLPAVDGTVSGALGLPDPARLAEGTSSDPQKRTEALWEQWEAPAHGPWEPSSKDRGPGSLRNTCGR